MILVDHLCKLEKRDNSFIIDIHDEELEKENYRFLALKAEKDREYLVREIDKYKNEATQIKDQFRDFKSANKT